MKIRPPQRWIASGTGASAIIRSRVSTRVMPGDDRPSCEMHELPWMISPTPAFAFASNASTYTFVASGPEPAPSSTGARYKRLRTRQLPIRIGAWSFEISVIGERSHLRPSRS
jgi:hypothetical protein